MVLSGWPCWAAIALGFLWLTAILRLATRAKPAPNADIRETLGHYGLLSTALSLALIIAFHATWLSPAFSQSIGRRIVSPLGLTLVLTIAAGIIFSAFGLGRARWIGLLSSLLLFGWYGTLATSAAILGPPVTRHSTHYIVPDYYTGWIEVRYSTPSASPLPETGSERQCRIPADGIVQTSTPFETGWATDSFVYASGLKAPVVITQTENGNRFKAFIGTEDQYMKTKGGAGAK